MDERLGNYADFELITAIPTAGIGFVTKPGEDSFFPF